MTIARVADGWSVTIETPEDPNVADDDGHRKIAAEVAVLGGSDRGYARAAVKVRVRTDTA